MVATKQGTGWKEIPVIESDNWSVVQLVMGEPSNTIGPFDTEADARHWVEKHAELAVTSGDESIKFAHFFVVSNTEPS